jgi:ComF family protein
MKRAFGIMSDYLFPSDCVACGRAVVAADNGVCGDCLGEIHPPRDACPRCGGQIVKGSCVICSDRAWYPDGCFAAAEYSGAMKELLRNYKFQKRKSLHRHIANIVFAALSDIFIEVDIVTAVPMAPAKVRKRGFNQSELVARAVAKRMGKEYRTLLREVARRQTQKDLNFQDRFLNVLGRYEVLQSSLKGLRILLLDDVFTTGATINECARLMKRSGALAVYAVACARRTIFEEMNEILEDVS